MSKTAIKLGPLDHGRRMSLDDFYEAEVQEGYLYELGRGIVVVSEVPRPNHLLVVHSIRRQFSAYDIANPGRIQVIASGGECKLPIADLASERHPDLAIYMTPPPEDEDVWSVWVPEIVIEIVSPGAEAERRDYVEKREEYLAFGVDEYLIFDATKRRLLTLRRYRGRWLERSLKPESTYQTRLLPGFELACAPIFQAADAAKR